MKIVPKEDLFKNPNHILTCPNCGCGNMHFNGKPEYREGHDNYDAAWDGKGDLATLPLFCESGCKLLLKIGFHKGNLYVFYEKIN